MEHLTFVPRYGKLSHFHSAKMLKCFPSVCLHFFALQNILLKSDLGMLSTRWNVLTFYRFSEH